ncbi:hypothetical protein [Actinoplanes sp. NBRC 101535]|uniref:hypothetical protein n=1 Tax=Actinoplanes sp. NBRC 101535 TaxID=3032196 RepID=UPI0024A55B16|nr:hypothetical protein [Actinoplanes sp. NBRC 101535]GLY08213.1 hypothetical protein Acsp01_85920 [Actinoplanes sp. NBRC 101535]
MSDNTMVIPAGRNYQNGDCATLATAIWEIAFLPTGEWKIAIFEGAGAHVVAITPDGRYLDSLGIRTEADIRGNWYEKLTIVNSAEGLYAEGWDAGCQADDYRAALAVLENAGLATDDARDRAAHEIEKLED